MPFDHSWFWPLLDRYRDQQGNTLEGTEIVRVQASGASPQVIDRLIAERQWQFSPKSEPAMQRLIQLIESAHGPSDSFTHLEFGTCFGTTIASVLQHFRNARGIGLEMDPARFRVSEWLVKQVGRSCDLAGRLSLQQTNLLEAELSPDSVDVVFMDTDHRYPDDYGYLMHLLAGPILRPGFLFIGDDPLHTGTKQARERLIREQSHFLDIATRPDWNLWWFRMRLADLSEFASPTGTDSQT